MDSRRFNDDAIARARSYDEVAEAYERVNAPLLFDAPARALVEYAALSRGEHVLDVGAGTGAVSRAAMAAGADVVALDPSLPMLMAAGRGGVSHLVCGSVPMLPFLDAVFDRVVSAFVMTHLDDPDAAACDMRRVLRSGGRIALSAWAPAEDPYANAWTEIVHEFARPELIADAAQRVLPGESRFARADGLSSLLAAAGFRDVQSESRTFEYAMSVDAMIATREVCATGRALRILLSDAQWGVYSARARDVLGRKFPDGIRYPREVFFAAGHS
jgi:ubiquinone/menaquinone biosynthesis C-methylase UbiE